MASISSLWVGPAMSLVHKISLASFVYYGHKVRLYVYDLDLEVPDGVVKVDARNILPESEIFYHQDQLAAFSDLFRYCMIKQTGEVWVDADTLCLSENFFEDKEFVFIYQSATEKWEEFCGGILKIPQDHPMIDSLILDTRAKIATGLNHWCDIGPVLITNKVNEYNLRHFGVNDRLTNMFTIYTDTVKFWDPKHTSEIIRMSKECHSATFFTGGLTARGIDKNSVVPGSAIEFFYNKFIGQPRIY
jgi:hypothetical protein